MNNKFKSGDIICFTEGYGYDSDINSFVIVKNDFSITEQKNLFLTSFNFEKDNFYDYIDEFVSWLNKKNIIEDCGNKVKIFHFYDNFFDKEN